MQQKINIISLTKHPIATYNLFHSLLNNLLVCNASFIFLPCSLFLCSNTHITLSYSTTFFLCLQHHSSAYIRPFLSHFSFYHILLKTDDSFNQFITISFHFASSALNHKCKIYITLSTLPSFKKNTSLQTGV